MHYFIVFVTQKTMNNLLNFLKSLNLHYLIIADIY